ncbi:MAG TPA: sigma-70 family RNA polymerase sigma factor [Hymenobacter sp.]|uniref:sigma-70 family RNA polymerase sigma factor n=1 Tax=Hymenobacter sp. TaxID=1898978 RepID=UPI002D80C24A|nr:sigma-70 family RNA polymerase sigma factor [Hymenobacter sp.]HET9503511.1 sigma-70 family RNA polymerase sigma factor [Hymenobacter sp.]
MAVPDFEAAQLTALSQGERAAFEALYHRYKQPVYANIRKMVPDLDAAEDLLQEVFIALWENRTAIDPAKGAGGWLFVVSYNKAASFLKKKLREAAILQPETDLAELAVADELGDEELYTTQLALVEEAVAHLPARKQAVFRLCRFEGKSAEEVAAATGISVASVRDYLKQSTRFIREYIQLGGTHTHTQALAVAGLLVLLELG